MIFDDKYSYDDYYIVPQRTNPKHQSTEVQSLNIIQKRNSSSCVTGWVSFQSFANFFKWRIISSIRIGVEYILSPVSTSYIHTSHRKHMFIIYTLYIHTYVGHKLITHLVSCWCPTQVRLRQIKQDSGNPIAFGNPIAKKSPWKHSAFFSRFTCRCRCVKLLAAVPGLSIPFSLHSLNAVITSVFSALLERLHEGQHSAWTKDQPLQASGLAFTCRYF